MRLILGGIATLEISRRVLEARRLASRLLEHRDFAGSPHPDPRFLAVPGRSDLARIALDVRRIALDERIGAVGFSGESLGLFIGLTPYRSALTIRGLWLHPCTSAILRPM